MDQKVLLFDIVNNCKRPAAPYLLGVPTRSGRLQLAASPVPSSASRARYRCRS